MFCVENGETHINVLAPNSIGGMLVVSIECEALRLEARHIDPYAAIHGRFMGAYACAGVIRC